MNEATRTGNSALRIDAERTALLVRSYRFEDLSNRKILARVRGAEPALHAVSDEAILQRWFTEYDAAIARLGSRHLRLRPGVNEEPPRPGAY